MVGLQTLYLPPHHVKTPFCSVLAKLLIVSVTHPSGVAELGQEDIIRLQLMDVEALFTEIARESSVSCRLK